MYLTRTAEDSTAPIATAEAKRFLKVTTSADDALIVAMVLAAVEHAEAFTGFDLRANTYKLFLDSFPDGDRITLPKGGVASVTSVEYLVSGVLTDFPTLDNWWLKFDLACAQIVLEKTSDWPTNRDDREQSVEVVFVTGSNEYQKRIIQGVLRHLAAMYTERGDTGDNVQAFGVPQPMVNETAKSSGAEGIYGPFSLVRI